MDAAVCTVRVFSWTWSVVELGSEPPPLCLSSFAFCGLRSGLRSMCGPQIAARISFSEPIRVSSFSPLIIQTSTFKAGGRPTHLVLVSAGPGLRLESHTAVTVCVLLRSGILFIQLLEGSTHTGSQTGSQDSGRKWTGPASGCFYAERSTKPDRCSTPTDRRCDSENFYTKEQHVRTVTLAEPETFQAL